MKKIIFNSILLVFFLFSCSSIDKQKELSFSAEVNASLNKEITIERAQSNTPDYIGYTVFNHTKETVTFLDQGFETTVYYYDTNTQKWTEILLPHRPDLRSKTLPAELETLSLDNTWSIFGDDITSLLPQEYRLYIEGTGDFTGKEYGAFFDFTILE